ncbi:MAG: acetyl-CoA carboxylase carboxyl transferase subunit alpha/beta, partial [Thermodesulfobacteria bacterium]|nr:acetyl-CoA carboxylase carboxyl transferase subunit alpha/beta [Thermodesulfobacteriota bacterium]
MEQKRLLDRGKYLTELADRINYLADIKGGIEWGSLQDLLDRVQTLRANMFDMREDELFVEMDRIDKRLEFLEDQVAQDLSPIEIVNIVRSPQRFTLQDILENCYDSFTELGGDGECNIDPAVVVARATITRRVKNKIYYHQVMVIGHEKGYGEEFRNGGCAKPWGNEKALRYMKVAETEGIPIHSYIFTPGAYPIEDYPGAAQQIARNLFQMSRLRVPIVAFISEGGSGGAEAIGLADIRLMASRGYYSVISPEGAAAIEGRIKEGGKVPRELVEHCAAQLKMTAEDNLKLKTIDRIIEEPPLGARRGDFAFFKRLRYEMVRATDEVVLQTKSFRAFRSYALKRQSQEKFDSFKDEFKIHIKWSLTDSEKKRLLELRSKKYRAMGKGYDVLKQPLTKRLEKAVDSLKQNYYDIRYGLLRQHSRQVQKIIEEVSSEGSVFLKTVTEPVRVAYDFVFPKPKPANGVNQQDPLRKSIFMQDWEQYISPLANEDKTVSCPNAEKYGCKDLWVPDLYGEFSGVCPTCGHHFPLEYQWYLENLFDPGS